MLTSSTIVIREATPEDAEGLIALDLALLGDGRGMVHCSRDMITDVSARAEKISALRQGPHDGILGVHYVALKEGRVLGAGILQRRSPLRLRHNAEGGLGVHPDAQGEGLGRLLSAHLLKWARAATLPPICRLELGTLANNTRAIALYESMGFEREGVQRRFFSHEDGSFVDNVLMALYL